MIDDDRDRGLAIAIALIATIGYLLTAPAVVNLDGLGYLKLLPHNFAAGHLLFMPLLRAATRVLGGDGLKVGRFINALLGGTGVLLMYGIARRLAPLQADRRFVATVAACGLAVSYGYWIQGADLEAYALATVAMLTLVRIALSYRSRPTLVRALAIGVVLGGAVLCHLTHVLLCAFVVAICLEDPRGVRKGAVAAALALGTGGALALGAYAYAAFVVRGHHTEGALRWVLSAAHGFHESAGAYVLAESIYGLARSIIWSPYLYESDAPRLLGQFLLGLAPLIGLAALARRFPHALRGLPLRPLAALTLPYAALALIFFGADTERWIFVLPALWFTAAILLDALVHRRLAALLVVVVIGLCNLRLAILPAHWNGPARHLAELAAAPLSDGDLLVFPGHTWDEYVSFYGGKKLEPFPLAYYAARDGAPLMWSRLEREAAAAAARGHHVYAVRLFDEHREVADDPAGYVELRGIGLSRATLRAQLEKRFSIVTMDVQEGVSLVRLDPVL